MPHNLKRIVGRGDLHFITFSCYQHRNFLASVRSKCIAVQILGEVRECFHLAVIGYVLMPDHIHVLISEPTGATPAKVIQVFNRRVSRKIAHQETRCKKATLFAIPRTGEIAATLLAAPLPRFQRVCTDDLVTSSLTADQGNERLGRSRQRLSSRIEKCLAAVYFLKPGANDKFDHTWDTKSVTSKLVRI